ncbi:hypothetical protein AN161_18830 [Lysinibacillus sp. FJAT-14222]|nr:hypothetical protein AN161_18830 [Lysinibacillus sp. FJAT-14222]
MDLDFLLYMDKITQKNKRIITCTQKKCFAIILFDNDYHYRIMGLKKIIVMLDDFSSAQFYCGSG